jgi:hypothetical protein
MFHIAVESICKVMIVGEIAEDVFASPWLAG